MRYMLIIAFLVGILFAEELIVTGSFKLKDGQLIVGDKSFRISERTEVLDKDGKKIEDLKIIEVVRKAKIVVSRNEVVRIVILKVWD